MYRVQDLPSFEPFGLNRRSFHPGSTAATAASMSVQNGLDAKSGAIRKSYEGSDVGALQRPFKMQRMDAKRVDTINVWESHCALRREQELSLPPRLRPQELYPQEPREDRAIGVSTSSHLLAALQSTLALQEQLHQQRTARALELLYFDSYLFMLIQHRHMQQTRQDMARRNVELSLSLLLCAPSSPDMINVTTNGSVSPLEGHCITQLQAACTNLLYEALVELPDNATRWCLCLATLLRVVSDHASSEMVQCNAWRWVHRHGVLRHDMSGGLWNSTSTVGGSLSTPLSSSGETLWSHSTTIAGADSSNMSDLEVATKRLLLADLGLALADSMTRFSESSTLQGLCLDVLRQASLSLVSPSSIANTSGPATTTPASANATPQSSTTTTTTATPSASLLGRHVWQALIGPICRAVTRHTDQAYVQLPGLALLAWLSEDATYRQLVWDFGTTHQEASLSNDDNHAATSRVPIIDSILNILHVHNADALVQCNAVATLCWLLHNPTPSSQSTMASAPAPPPALALARAVSEYSSQILPVILHALQRHVADPSVFGNCVCLLTALPMLAETNSTSPSASRRRSSESSNNNGHGHLLDQIEAALLHGMKQHLASHKVQACCFWWMYSLVTAIAQANAAAADAASLVANHAAPVDNVNGHSNSACRLERLIPFLSCIVESMQAHGEDASLQGQACFILSNMADTSSMPAGSTTTTTAAAEAVLRSHSIDAILTALTRHGTTHPAVQQGAAWCLIALAAAAQRHRSPVAAATAAFGGGLHIVDVIWEGMGIVEEEEDMGEEDMGDEDDDYEEDDFDGIEDLDHGE